MHSSKYIVISVTEKHEEGRSFFMGLDFGNERIELFLMLASSLEDLSSY